MKKLTAFALAAMVLIPGQAFAFDWVVGAKVTQIEASYGPTLVDFSIDQNGGSCSAGQLLYWFAQGSDIQSKATNYEAILATLLTAKSTGQHVTVFGNDSGCTIEHVYIS